MSDVNSSPETLREFACNLTHFHDSSIELTQILNNHFSTLEETWNDGEYHKFQEEYEEFSASLLKFLEAIDSYVPFLNDKAGSLEDYLARSL